MEYIIYTYGGLAELIAQIFNSIAMLFYSNSDYFTVVGKLAFTVGGIWAGTRAIFNTNIGIFGKHWFFPSFLAFTFLFAPKATVHIHDAATKEAYTVANVPFAVAFFSSVPSKLSYYLANEIEEKMATPESVKSTHNGVMFGARLISKIKDVKVNHPILLDNAKEFSKQCYLRPWIMGNLLGKREEAQTTKDIITFLKTNKANNFGMYYKDKNGGSVFKTCADITDTILTDLETEAQSHQVLGSLDSSLGQKDMNQEQLARRITQTGAGALQALSQETNDFHQRVRQSMMLNVYRESLDDWRESAGYERYHPQLVSMNATRGMFQQSLGWMISGEMAAQMLPLLQTIIFLMAACSIFVVFPLTLFPGGIEILKVWLKSLIWVHTWPVFFAIINCIGMAVLSTRLGSFGEDYGMDKITQGGFSDKLMHTYAIVQLMAASVPIFSWALLNKGGYAFANMVDRMSPMSAGAGIGAGIADGNLNLDNQSISGRSINQQNIGSSLDDSSIYNSGVERVTQSKDGQTFVNQNMSNLRENFRGSDITQSTLNQSFGEQSSKVNALTTREGELATQEQTDLQDFAKRWTTTNDTTTGENSRVANDMRTVASGGINTTDGYSDRTSKTTDTHSSADMTARFGVDTDAGLLGRAVKAVTGVDLGFNTTAQTGVGARNTDEVGHEQSAQQTQQYNEALGRVREYAQTHGTTEGSGAADSLSQSLQNTWREQGQVSEDKSQALQKMESIKKEQMYVQQNQSTIDSNWNDKVLEKIQTDQGLSTKQEALAYSDSHPGVGRETLQSLVNEKYGIATPQEIKDKGDALNKTVNAKVPDQPINFEDRKAELQSKQKQQTQKIAAESGLQNKVESNLQAARDKGMGTKATQSSGDFAQSMQKEGMGGKVKVPDADKVQKDLASQKEKFEDVSNSTVVRAGKRVSQNVDDAGNPIKDNLYNFAKKSRDLILDNAKETDKVNREINPFDSQYKPRD